MAEPTLLYKYLDSGGIKVLKNGTLRGSIPTKVNDPFEFRPGYLLPTDEEILSSVANEDVLIDMFWRMLKDKPDLDENFRASIRQYPQKILACFRQKDVCDAHFEAFNEGAKAYRMLCFSLRNDGILMWSHYADHHRGFVLGFAKAPLDAGFPTDQGFPVEYRSERPCIGNVIDAFRDGVSKELERVVRTKSLEWAYEEEYRYYGEQQQEGNNDAPFEPAMLHQVIFGSQCLPRLKKRSLKILGKPEYQHVRKSYAFLSPRKFKIEIKDE